MNEYSLAKVQLFYFYMRPTKLSKIRNYARRYP